MQRAKAFFYVCAGLLMLALSYHFGAATATAQTGNSIGGFTVWQGLYYVVTPNGDVYYNTPEGTQGGTTPIPVGNFWGGTSVNVERHTLGQLKQRFRDPVQPQTH